MKYLIIWNFIYKEIIHDDLKSLNVSFNKEYQKYYNYPTLQLVGFDMNGIKEDISHWETIRFAVFEFC